MQLDICLFVCNSAWCILIFKRRHGLNLSFSAGARDTNVCSRSIVMAGREDADMISSWPFYSGLTIGYYKSNDNTNKPMARATVVVVVAVSEKKTQIGPSLSVFCTHTVMDIEEESNSSESDEMRGDG